MFCRHCGAKVEDGDEFCQFCGGALNKSSAHDLFDTNVTNDRQIANINSTITDESGEIVARRNDDDSSPDAYVEMDNAREEESIPSSIDNDIDDDIAALDVVEDTENSSPYGENNKTSIEDDFSINNEISGQNNQELPNPLASHTYCKKNPNRHQKISETDRTTAILAIVFAFIFPIAGVIFAKKYFEDTRLVTNPDPFYTNLAKWGNIISWIDIGIFVISMLFGVLLPLITCAFK